MKKNNIKKFFIIFLLVITLSGCNTVLKDKDNKPVRNNETGQNITENILCRPTDKKLIKIYEENGKDLKELSDCNKMKAFDKYEGIWTTVFVKPLAFLIIKLGNVVKSQGLSIIIITIIIRLLLFPITKKTAMQSETIKQAQPELERLEKKYANKTDNASLEKKQMEMLAIYKKYNINPLSGCIFAFIQLPLLFAFLEAINRVPAIFEETFLHFQMGTTPWIALSHGKWYYLILVVLIIGTTFLSFKMNQSSSINEEMEKQNKMMMIFMTIFIGFTSFTLPSAIAIYWITSSLFTIGQNFITDKSIRSKRK